MEKFSVGLAKSAVEGTLVAVRSAIEEERRLKVQFTNDLVFIIDEFEMMQSFLRGTNSGERVAKNQLVGTWVRRVRRLAFDVEDCVEFVVHLEKSSALDWVRRLAYHFTCRTSLLPLDLAVAQIQELKARVVDVSQRNTRYSLLTNFDDVPASKPEEATTPYAGASSNMLHDVWEAAGEGRHWTRDLKPLIRGGGTDLEVISVWVSTPTTEGGGGGAAAAHHPETAYVISEAYDDPEIRREFETRARVKLMHPFDPDHFLESLLTQLYCNSFHPRKIGAELGKNLKAKVARYNDYLMGQLSQQKYLVILEDVTDVAEWDAIRMFLPVTNNGSRIVVYTAQHIGLARFCTGGACRVSELKRFSKGQSLCAFSNELAVRRSDLGELNWQITRGGVISLLHAGGPFAEADVIKESTSGDHPYHIQMLYKYIMHMRIKLDIRLREDVKEKQSWVNLNVIRYHMKSFSVGLLLEAFSVGLFLGFQRRDFQAKDIKAVGGQGHQAIVRRCRRYLRHYACLVVINGLSEESEWEMIKDTFLLSGEPINKGTSIIVITTDRQVAEHCVDDQQHRVFCMDKDVKHNKALNRFIEDYKCSEIGGKQRSRLFHDTESLSYSNFEFQLIGRDNEVSALERQLQDPGVISVWGSSGFGKSLIVKKVYYGEMRKDLFESLSFVDLPGRDPFDLTDFSWQLLLDFYTRKPRIKEKIVNSLYKGQQDPIQACCRVLRRRKCLVVIDGLQFRGDWDKIRDTFFPPDDQPIKGCVVVITKDNSLARHCVAADDRVLGVERLRVFRRLPLTELRRPQVSFLYHLVGRDKESEWLRCLQPGVYSLWGVAGVGKSALVRDYCLRNQNLRQIWVDVPDPFDLTEFSRRLLVGYHSHDLRTPEIAAVAIIEGQDTVHGCRQILREITCLLIIDGLRSKDDWDLIRASFLSEHNDHTMIVISNEASVATHCASRDECRVFNVKGLKATHSLHLFRQIAWDAGKDQLTTEEREFSEAILAKCGGLPKVIVAIGEYASERIASLFYFQALTRLSTEIHHDFMGKLEMDSRFHSLRGLFCWMQSYFDACSDELKPCIFYLLVFLNIRRRRMLRRWIAEGYSAEDNAEMLFDQFVDLSIIQKQETPSSGRNMYQVNGFFLEYIKSRPMEDNLVFVLEEHYCSPNTQHTIQHLAIMSSWDRDQIVFESMDLTRLRSLTIFGEWMSFFISADTKMRLLRVLDLENTTSGVTDDDLEQILKLLRRLKFLSLRGCRDINRLPDSLGCLRQLQTLDVRHTKIRMLPRAIIKLVKLQYLRAGTTTHKSSDEGVLPAADEDGCTSICSQTPASRQGDDSDDASSSLQIAFGDGDVASTSLQIASEGDGDVASTSLQIASEGDGDGTSTRLQIASGGDGGGTSTSQQAAADGGVASTSQQADKVLTAAPRSWTRARDLVVLCRKKLRRRRRSHADDGSVVEVALGAAKEMGKLNALHTLGVVHVGNGAAGKAFLVELKKLTQLRKLAVSGINRKNWHKLYSAVSGHLHYLESLSVRIDKAAEAASFFSDEIFTKDVPNGLPKSLKSLKLYAEDGKGNVHVSPVLIKQLGNLTKFNFELTVSTQQDIDSLLEVPSHTGNLFHHLYVKPIQDGQLCYAPWRPSDSDWVLFSKVKVVEIDCGSYRSEIFLGEWVPPKAEVLVVHCSSAESSLELSGLEELDCVKEGDLKEVRLKGSYSEALKQHLQKKLDELEDPRWGDRPELKT